jgi:hypothetical protein
MTKRSCGCEISETVMMASWPSVVETSEDIALVGGVEISTSSSFSCSEYIYDYHSFFTSKTIFNSISDQSLQAAQ